MGKATALQSLGDLPIWWWGLLALCVAGFALLWTSVRRRGTSPLKGIVVYVDAKELLRDEAAVTANGARLRQKVGEMAQQVRLRLPVHVVVTGLESLEGYGVVHAALPAEVRAQAIGHRLRDNGGPDVDEAIDTLFTRLHALRMALLRAHPQIAERLAVHRFFEALRVSETGLRLLAKEMFTREERDAATQLCLGFYLAAAVSDGGVGGAFTEDLFRRFLPADQAFARMS